MHPYRSTVSGSRPTFQEQKSSSGAFVPLESPSAVRREPTMAGSSRSTSNPPRISHDLGGLLGAAAAACSRHSLTVRTRPRSSLFVFHWFVDYGCMLMTDGCLRGIVPPRLVGFETAGSPLAEWRVSRTRTSAGADVCVWPRVCCLLCWASDQLAGCVLSSSFRQSASCSHMFLCSPRQVTAFVRREESLASLA